MTRGTKARYFCFDCGESTGAYVAVYRDNGRGSKIFVYVHRAGAGCKKGVKA